MAVSLQLEEILKAAREMTKEERLELIAAIASLPEKASEYETARSDSDEEVMKAAREFMDKYPNLLRRLAE
jgi:hypothetical protein